MILVTLFLTGCICSQLEHLSDCGCFVAGERTTKDESVQTNPADSLSASCMITDHRPFTGNKSHDERPYSIIEGTPHSKNAKCLYCIAVWLVGWMDGDVAYG